MDIFANVSGWLDQNLGQILWEFVLFMRDTCWVLLLAVLIGSMFKRKRTRSPRKARDRK